MNNDEDGEEKQPIVREGNQDLTIDNSLINVLDMVYLLSNHNGYLDGDKHCLRIKK